MTEAGKSTRRRSRLRIVCGALLIVGVLFLIAAFVRFRYTPSNYFPPDVVEVLRKDPGTTLFSIDPYFDSEDPKDSLRSHRIYGKTVVGTEEDRDTLVNVLTESTRGAQASLCFDPRHALRATGPKGTYELIICFECGHVQVHHPDGRMQWIMIRASADKYNSYLKTRNIPLPEH